MCPPSLFARPHADLHVQHHRMVEPVQHSSPAVQPSLSERFIKRPVLGIAGVAERDFFWSRGSQLAGALPESHYLLLPAETTKTFEQFEIPLRDGGAAMNMLEGTPETCGSVNPRLDPQASHHGVDKFHLTAPLCPQRIVGSSKKRGGLRAHSRTHGHSSMKG